jgi:acetyl esterase/lipase
MLEGLVVALVVSAGGGPAVTEPPPLMTAGDVADLPRPPAHVRIEYGPDPLQFGELRLPDGGGPHPVVIVIHGGCWLAEYDLGHVSSLAAALAESGVATWSVEYRRVGDDGGGWPGTFLDVAAAADRLRELAEEFPLDLERVVAVGHSAGGHLALWLAARHRLPTDDPFKGRDPLPLVGVVALAGIPDLAAYAAPAGCGAAVPDLLGGALAEVPERLRRASPIELVPLGVPQTLVVGGLDTIVPAGLAGSFADAARGAGDRVEVREVRTAGHFELIAPGSAAWPTVRDAVLAMVAGGAADVRQSSGER